MRVVVGMLGVYLAVGLVYALVQLQRDGWGTAWHWMERTAMVVVVVVGWPWWVTR